MSMRRMHGERHPGVWLAGCCALLWLSACVDTKKVIVDAAAFDDPPAASAGFIGYANADADKPVCGNCHVGKYAEWKETKHADAWGTLQNSGHAAAACENCHSVGPNGNATTGTVGFAATKDLRYRDVQCESCHGPGLTHVTNPDGSQPVPSIEVDTARGNGCGECHNGVHNPFVEEWTASRHGKRNTTQQAEEGCVECHEAKHVLEGWGVKTEYSEKEDESHPVPIVCVVCHDPHDNTNEHQLRYSIGVADVEQNLCMKCHHKRAVPDPTSTRGAHSPQGPLLIGKDAGWIPAALTGYTNGSIVGTHGGSGNKDLCVTCHVQRMEVADAGGKFLYNSTGHHFKPIPCLNEQGIPTNGTSCTMEQRSFKACTASGCHGSEAAARSALTVARTRLGDLSAKITAMLVSVPKSEYVTGDNRITTAEGAKFNADLCIQGGSAAHNPFLCEALLTATIKQLKTDYGVAVPAGLVLSNVLEH